MGYMPRAKRKSYGGYLYHVLNRANGRLRIFRKAADFAAFEAILGQGQERTGMRICGYCLMGNHWHLLLWPRHDGELSEYMRWVTVTHTQRYHAAHRSAGTGHIYQGRFKSFPIQGQIYYVTAMRYVEGNPLRAGLVTDAADWPWSSYGQHVGGAGRETPITLSEYSTPLPENWDRVVHANLSEKDCERFQNAIRRGCPLGDAGWTEKIAAQFELESTLRPRGRPRST